MGRTRGGANKQTVADKAPQGIENSPAQSLDELHREMGERLAAGLAGVLDFLAGLRRNDALTDMAQVATAIRQAFADELAPLHREIRELRNLLEETQSNLHRILVQTAPAVRDEASTQTSVVAQPTAVRPASVSERVPRAMVTERMLITAKNLQESGRDISQMTAASLAREAGVKPAQFTYAFKNRENFMQQYSKWLAQPHSA